MLNYQKCVIIRLMKPVPESIQKARGWYYIGKQIYYWRNCDFCLREYKGMGKSYCSYSCSRFANPIIMMGENHPNYIKDRSLIKTYDDRRGDILNKTWKEAIKKRDNFICKIKNKDCCGILEIHHILNWADYPELRYEINNGITLCHNHHPKGRKKEQLMVPTFMNIINNFTK